MRGEIDNRVKGIIRGRIWLEGRAEPVVLELEGNAWPDLAGCLLTFTNPREHVKDPGLEALHPLQRGSIGDLTASRKVRVFDVPLSIALEMFDRDEKAPEHLANCLYLEWFSEANGRVVIESADYDLTISTPEWRLQPEEEAARAQQAAEGMAGFMRKINETIERHQRNQKDPEQPWDEHDYEKFFRECDARTDKYGELLDKYGDAPEAEARINQEMGWTHDTAEDDGEGLDAEAMDAMSDEAEPEPEAHREGLDWIRTPAGDLRHPLQYRCCESALKFRGQIEALGLNTLEDADLERFTFSFHTTATKLAGALNSIARGVAFPDGAFTVAYLKRALGHLHESQAGLEAVASRKLLPETMIIEARQELFEIREGILRLMDEYRGRV